jgi:deoxyribodipyrimidine photolyase-related protein
MAQDVEEAQSTSRGPDMGNLVLILGDQFSRSSETLDGFDKAADALWMAEVQEDATHVWSYELRIALFLISP